MQSSNARLAKQQIISLPFLITTKNLVLRPLLNEDIALITNAIDANLPELKRWLPGLGRDMQSIDSAQLAQYFYDEVKSNKANHLVVYNDHDFIGMVSLYDLSDNGLTVKLGYWFNTAANIDMAGIFREALRAITQFAFDEWKVLTLIIPCVAGNFFNETTAKELKFKIKRIDLVGGKFIKIYELSNFEHNNRIEMTIV